MEQLMFIIGGMGATLRALTEVGLLAILIYSILYFLRGTRAAPVLSGISLVVFLLSLVSTWLELTAIEWLLVKMWAVMSFAVLVIFQPEIRRALAETGSQLTLRQVGEKDVRVEVDILLDSVFYLAERRLGALIVLEQKIGLRPLAETGTPIRAPLSRELLSTLFFPNTPLHDGGVIVRANQLVAAGCILPLTQDAQMSKSLGTRHRAGVGVTEESDALALIVSEETGSVSIAYKGRLLHGLNRQRVERHLMTQLLRNRERSAVSRFSQWVIRLRAALPKWGQGEDEEPGAV